MPLCEKRCSMRFPVPSGTCYVPLECLADTKPPPAHCLPGTWRDIQSEVRTQHDERCVDTDPDARTVPELEEILTRNGDLARIEEGHAAEQIGRASCRERV